MNRTTIQLSDFGRIFYGLSISGLGILTVYQQDFPYMLIPSKHSWIPGLTEVAIVFGAFLIFCGAAITFNKKAKSVANILGIVLLLIFCFYFIPYQFSVSKNFLQFGDWENAAKELALSAGAFLVAGRYSKNKLFRFGAILYAITILSFSIDHFLYAQEAVGYVPSWIPFPLFWMYFCGAALAAAAVAILLKIKIRLAAIMLGSMIFTWFIILHIPYVIEASSKAARLGETASAFLALAYSGAAFLIA